MNKLAFFCFEAAPNLGAGHAIRSCVIADALAEEGWICKLVTKQASYEFIANLNRFERIDPEDFYNNPEICDLLLIDNYELDYEFETRFRSFAKKIMVIDDLANRKHDCDILLDQTYGRDAADYNHLVPTTCKILAGSDYVLLRKEILQLRPMALEKRRYTKEIKRILVSMGGSDPQNYTQKALQMINESGFKGAIDIVLGFQATNLEAIECFIATLSNDCKIHINADMPKLVVEGDLAIGAAGSSVWERCCLGLPQYLIQIADNQGDVIKSFTHLDFLNFYSDPNKNYYDFIMADKVDGLGVFRVMNHLNPVYDKSSRLISHNKVHADDMDLIFDWQQNQELRRYSFNKHNPSYDEHKKWFGEKLKSQIHVFEKITANEVPCGTLRLDYCFDTNSWKLSWYVIPEFQGNGIGSIALNFSKKLAVARTINAFVFKENIASHKAITKSGFTEVLENKDGSFYAY